MTAPHYTDDAVTLYAGDCLDVLPTLPDASVDAVCTDPPYGLGFMGRAWDDLPPGREWAAECLRVLKPGGHLLAFGGTRTWHRLVCAIEDAGFEIRDSIAWLYGSGFPKSLDVSKAIDRAVGAEREVVGSKLGQPGYSLAPGRPSAITMGTFGQGGDPEREAEITAPATADAQRWQGWGTALKPAHEPIVVARKPLIGTVAANVLRWGTGALNIDAGRVGFRNDSDKATVQGATWYATQNKTFGKFHSDGEVLSGAESTPDRGRWPANVALDETAAAALDRMSGESASHDTTPGGQWTGTMHNGSTYNLPGSMETKRPPGRGDTGGASRFFYTAKAGSDERITHDGVAHPTVKPLSLMRWLVRLVTPLGGVILEPFAGSGTTVEAAILEGFRCIAIEREADYLPLITQRINRRRDPVAYLTAAGEDLGLLDFEEPA